MDRTEVVDLDHIACIHLPSQGIYIYIMCIIYINIIRFLEIKLRIYKFIPNDCRVILIYIYIYKESRIRLVLFEI